MNINNGKDMSSKKSERQAKTFIPNQQEALNEVPEAITSGERLPHVSEYSAIRLEVWCRFSIRSAGGVGSL